MKTTEVLKSYDAFTIACTGLSYECYCTSRSRECIAYDIEQRGTFLFLDVGNEEWVAQDGDLKYLIEVLECVECVLCLVFNTCCFAGRAENYSNLH